MEQIPLWVSLTQIGASVFLGLAALAVGIASATISYRNNFGWKPVVFPTWHRYTIGPIGGVKSVVFAFDI